MDLYVVQHFQWPINLQTRRHAVIIIKMVQKRKLDICSTITWHDYSVDGAYMAVKRWLEPQELATEGSVPVALQAAQCEPPSPDIFLGGGKASALKQTSDVSPPHKPWIKSALQEYIFFLVVFMVFIHPIKRLKFAEAQPLFCFEKNTVICLCLHLYIPVNFFCTVLLLTIWERNICWAEAYGNIGTLCILSVTRQFIYV